MLALKAFVRSLREMRGGRYWLGAAIFCCVALALTQYRADTYPPSWPRLLDEKRSATQTDPAAADCPDLAGTYELPAKKPPCCGFDERSTFLADTLTESAANAWQTVAISGVTGRGLTFTYSRPASSRDVAPATLTIDEPYGKRYRCEKGWLVGEAVPVFINSAEKGLVVANTSPVRAGNLPSYFRKDVDGNLVARVDARRILSATLISATPTQPARYLPYWTFISPQWARWPKFAPSPLNAANNAVLPLSINDKPAAQPAMSSADIDALLRTQLSPGTLPGSLVLNSDRYVFTFYSDTQAQNDATLKSLQQAPALQSVAANSSLKNGAGLIETTVSFRLRDAGAGADADGRLK